MSRELALQIRVNQKERQLLAAIAEETGLTQSAVVRQLIHEVARKLNVYPVASERPGRQGESNDTPSISFS